MVKEEDLFVDRLWLAIRNLPLRLALPLIISILLHLWFLCWLNNI